MLPLQIYFSLYILVWYGTTGSNGLKNVRLDAPRYVRNGEDMTLSCQYDIDIRSLYAVKWYRGQYEFARYLPKEIPPQQVFSQRGIYVNESLLNEHQIRLTNISRESSGIYKCVVSAETTFKTLSDDQEVLVVVVGYESPSLFVDQADYSHGDTVHANCSVLRTSHPVNLTWYFNNVEVSKSRPNSHAKSFLVHDSDDSEILTSISTLSIVLPEKLNMVRLKCTGQLYDVYNMSTDMEIPIKPRKYSMMSTSPDTLTKRYNHTLRGNAVKLNQNSLQRFIGPILGLILLQMIICVLVEH